MSYVCPSLCGLFPIEDCIGWVAEGHGEKSKKIRSSVIGRVPFVVGSTTGGRQTGQGPIQASCRLEDNLVLKTHAPPLGVCDNMISAWRFLPNLQEKESFIDVVYDGTKEGSRRKMVLALTQLAEIDSHKALVSVRLLDQHRAVEEVVGLAYDSETFPGANI